MRLLLAALAAIVAICWFPQNADAAATWSAQWSARATGGTSQSLSIPTTATAGDVLAVFVDTLNSASGGPCPVVTPAPGFTGAGTSACGNNRDEDYVWTGTAAGNDTVVASATVTTGTIYMYVTVVDIDGGNPSAPVDAISSFTSALSPASPISGPAMSTTLSGDLVVSNWSNAYEPATGLSCSSPCSGAWTLFQESVSATAPNATFGYQTITSIGASNPPGMSFSGTVSQDQAVTVAFAPATGLLNTLAELGAGGPHQTTSGAPPPATFTFVLSGYTSSPAPATAQWAKYASPYSDVEVTSGDWAAAHSSTPYNRQSYHMYTEAGQYDGFMSLDQAPKFQEQHESDFMHIGDPADLSVQPGSGQCTLTFNANYWDSAHTGTYKIYNAATDGLISTITASGATLSYVNTGLTNGTTYYYYIDWQAVNTTATANISTGTQTVTPASIANIQANTSLRVCNAGGVTCENVKTINYSGTTLTAVFALAHTCSSGSPCTIVGERAYSSLSNIDGWNGLTNPAMPNTNGDVGKRLSGTADANGWTAPHCTPALSPALALSNSSVTLSPNPRPNSGETTNGTQPAVSTTITVSASVTEVGSSSAPLIKYIMAPVDGGAWTTITGTWSLSGSVWSFAGGSFVTPSTVHSSPAVFEICQGSTCTMPFAGTAQTENERMSYGNAPTLNYIKALQSCSAQLHSDIEATWTNGYFGSMHLMGTTYPPTASDTMRINTNPVETYLQPDIWNSQSSYQPTTSGNFGTLGGSGGEYNQCGMQSAPYDFFSWENAHGVFAYSYEASFLTAPQEAAQAAAGAQMDIYDDFMYTSATGHTWSTMAPCTSSCGTGTNFLEGMNTAATGGVNAIAEVIHPVIANASPLSTTAQADYLNVLAGYYLIADGTYASLRLGTDSNLWTYNIEYLQMGVPSQPLPTATVDGETIVQLGPQSTCAATCDFSKSGGLWNATDQMFERSFSNGMAFFCPPGSGTNQTACKTYNFGKTVYEVNAPTDSVENGDATNTWTPITSLSLSANTGATIEWVKQ